MNVNEKENASEFEEDEELLDELARMSAELDKCPAVLNVEELKKMQLAYKILENNLPEDVTIRYSLHQPVKSFGSITIEGPMVEFIKPQVIAAAMILANNVDIYPIVSGDVRVVFTFNRLTKIIC